MALISQQIFSFQTLVSILALVPMLSPLYHLPYFLLPVEADVEPELNTFGEYVQSILRIRPRRFSSQEILELHVTNTILCVWTLAAALTVFFGANKKNVVMIRSWLLLIPAEIVDLIISFEHFPNQRDWLTRLPQTPWHMIPYVVSKYAVLMIIVETFIQQIRKEGRDENERSQWRETPQRRRSPRRLGVNSTDELMGGDWTE